MKKPEALVRTVDGHPRSADAEEKLNEACYLALTSPAGVTMMQWLRSITTDFVLGAEVESRQMHYQEGMRMVTALLAGRIAAHRAAMTKVAKAAKGETDDA